MMIRCSRFLSGLVGALLLSQISSSLESDDLLMDNSRSGFSRNMASLASKATTPNKPTISRHNFPETAPHVCLAFLSCCDRTDLLNHTLAGVIRHMEEDEPPFLRYEIAWVDNGSDPQGTAAIADSYQIEHSLRLTNNMGLAYGMNLLIFNLCTAPYILLLEEDWLYLDELVAPQSPERKRAIATSIALVEDLARHNVTAFDSRKVMGVFLRHESYERFLKFPFMDNWDTREQVNLVNELARSREHTAPANHCEASDESMTVDIDYRIFCGDTSLSNEALW